MWTLLFILVTKLVTLAIPTLKLWSIRNRIVSLIHGVLMLGLCAISISHNREMRTPNEDFNSTLICLSLAYFIFDFLCILKYGIYDKCTILHHILSFVGMITIMITDVGAVDAIYGILYVEISVPLLCSKEILESLNQKNTQLHLLCELSFYSFYCFCHFVLGIPLIYKIMISWDTHWVERLVALLLAVQSFQHGFVIARISYKRYDQYKVRLRKGEQLTIVNPLKEENN